MFSYKNSRKWLSVTCRNIFEACSVSGVPQGDLLCAILFYYRKLYMQIGRFSIKNVKCNLQGMSKVNIKAIE